MRLRVIAGTLGGRTFEAPSGHKTHPMSEKIRGAIFNMLGDIKGLYILDAFAGSGALAFEAVSRGAKKVIAVELDTNAHKTIELNIMALGTSNITTSRANVGSWVKTNSKDRFDIILCDPPYDHVNPELLESLAWHVKPGGILVLSLPPDTRILLPEDVFTVVSQKNYGDATLVFYRRLG